MGNNKKLGTEGERLAREYLKGKGYEILAQNYRSGKSEIDLVVQKGKTLVFVEVKTRSRTDFGMPEDWVNEHQAEKIIEGAEDYIEDRNWEGDIRFDIISIIIKSVPEIEHFEDAFY
jgi:putative endonuclease